MNAVEEVGSALPSLPARLLAVLVAPGKLFASLREEPRWAAALVLGAVLSTAATAMIPTEMWVEAMREAMRERGQSLPPDFDVGSVGLAQKVFGVAWTFLFWFILAFALAGVTSFLFSFLLGDRGGYRPHLAVVSHALLIAAAGALLVAPLRIVGGDPRLTLDLALFFPLEEGFVADFLGALDLFWLWTFVVIGIGAHELDRRRTVAVAVAAVLTIPVTLALVAAWLSGL